jgi:hypothetical protein
VVWGGLGCIFGGDVSGKPFGLVGDVSASASPSVDMTSEAVPPGGGKSIALWPEATRSL